jgi:uroporphyrinogen decarboxylase
MNGYERIKAALSGMMPDKRPVMLHNVMPAIQEAGYTMKKYRSNPEVAAECHIRYAEKYGLDGILFDVDTAIEASAIGVPVDYPDNEPARTDEILLESLNEIDKLGKIDISQHPRVQHSLETIQLMKNYFRDELFIRGNCDQAPFSLACSMRGFENFMMDLFVDGEKVEHLLKYTTGICRQFIRLMAKAGVDMLSNDDSLAAPSMISPEMYEKFAMPYEKELVDEAHRCRLPYLLHICGDMRSILPQMNRLGLDAVELDHKTPIGNIFEVFGNTSTLVGTIDPNDVIALGTPDMVRRESIKILDTYHDSPRLVLGSGCAIPYSAPEENIREIVRCAHG